MAWSWENGFAELETYDSRLAEEVDSRMQLQNSQDGKEVIVKKIGPDEEYRALGAFISASSKFEAQIRVLKKNTQLGIPY